MSDRTGALLLTVAFSVMGACADYLLKTASTLPRPFLSRWFLAGLALYAITAFAWTHVMAYLKLATISIVYSISLIVLLTLLGLFVFHERLRPNEWAGLILAVASLILLTRFGD
jgi:drug/metabolite transporter (DMT)-like permease